MLHGVPCSLTALPPCSFLTDTITALVLPLSHLKKKKKVCSFFCLYCTIHYTPLSHFFVVISFVFRLALSPSRSCSSSTTDGTVPCDVGIGRDYFCSIAQYKTEKKTRHNAHQLSMGNFYCRSSRSLVSLISGSRKVCRWSIIEKTWYMEEVNPEVLCKYIACSAVPLPSNFLIQDSMMCSEGILVWRQEIA